MENTANAHRSHTYSQTESYELAMSTFNDQFFFSSSSEIRCSIKTNVLMKLHNKNTTILIFFLSIFSKIVYFGFSFMVGSLIVFFDLTSSWQSRIKLIFYYSMMMTVFKNESKTAIIAWMSSWFILKWQRNLHSFAIQL